MSAAGFRLARVSPLLGRTILEDDERADAPAVVVIGYDVWQNRLGADPAIIGRTVRLDRTIHTVIGVMPEGFAFPVDHAYWVPLRARPSAYARLEGPEIFIFGRLAPGVTMAAAQAELTVLGERAAAEFPETNARLRPMVMPYTHSIIDIQGFGLWQFAQAQFMMSLLLIAVGLNVAILVYARTALRLGEFAVRTALGASRARIVGQMFVEALVLCTGATALGLGLAQFGMRQGTLIMETEVGVPFWTDYGLRGETVLFTAAIALFVTAIVGVIPAIQATGPRLQADLRQLGGGTGVQLGKVWTLLIVAQVAIAVAALPTAMNVGFKEIRGALTRPTFPVDEILVATVAAEAASEDQDAPSDSVRPFGPRLRQLLATLRSEPAAAAVTFTAGLPGRSGGFRVEAEGVPAPVESPSGALVTSMGVDPSYFDVFDAPVVLGREFQPADAGEASTTVLVNRSFVRNALGGEAAIGRRIRYLDAVENAATGEREPGPWYEIVGVVEDVYANAFEPERIPSFVYYPVDPSRVQAAALAIRIRGTTPAGFADRFREIVAASDPALRLGPVRARADLERQAQIALRLMAIALATVLIGVLLLTGGGIYALMSFTVTRRQREIGIRTALGAHPRQVLGSIFSRAATQIALGLFLGLGMAALLDSLTDGGLLGGNAIILLPAFAAIMIAVGLVAALGPARRGLRVQPAAALRADR
jgi:predicted permease